MNEMKRNKMHRQAGTLVMNKIFGVVFLLLLVLFLGLFLLIPDTKVSNTERRSMARRPEISITSIVSGNYMKDLEAYFLDQMPGRDLFRSAAAEFKTRGMRTLDANGYYMCQGKIIKSDMVLEEKNILRAAKGFQQISNNYFEDSNIYLSIIPDKNYYGAKELGYPSMDHEDLQLQISEEFPEAAYIDLYEYLTLEDYYSTDLHWRQECISEVGDQLLLKMGREKKKEIEWEKVTATEDFLGGYAGASAFVIKPEELIYLESSLTEDASVYDYEKGVEVPFYAEELSTGKDPYDVFLWGPRALLTVEQKEIESYRNLLIFRDSFASSILPYLLEGYDKITLIDLRYTTAEYAMNYLEGQTYEDILFLYSSTILNHSESLRLP